MSDSYQAIYDAARSRIGSADAGDAIYRAVVNCFDLGMFRQQLTEQMYMTASEMQRPSVLYRPQLMPDGTKWCALYGENLAVGVAGFGDTPDAAMRAFDEAWLKQRTPTVVRTAKVPA